MQKKIKVLYLDSPLDPPGGGQFSLLLLGKYLDKDIFDISVYVREKIKFYDLFDKTGRDLSACHLAAKR